MESIDRGFFSLLESLWLLCGPGVLHKDLTLQLHGQDMNQRILNLSILLGSLTLQSPGVGPILG